eukprot:COSAG02_NODE_13563_length_1378_cov_31.838155_1_plen_451_part_01
MTSRLLWIFLELDHRPKGFAQSWLRDITSLGRSFSFLLDAYRFDRYYYEVIDILRKLLLVGLVLVVKRGTVAQNVVALLLSFAFFSLLAAARPYKLHADNLYRAATEVHVFLVIVAGLVSHANLVDEAIQENFYDWGLFISFVVLVPGALVVTVSAKVRSASNLLADGSLNGSFSRLCSGIASDSDRDILLNYVETIRESLGPLQNVGITCDLDKPIQGAQSATATDTVLCLGRYQATSSAATIICAIKIRPRGIAGLSVEGSLMTSPAAQHPNICQSFAAVEADGLHYLSMQLCETTVQSAVHSNSLQNVLGNTSVASMCRGIAEGLYSLHSLGYIHGNIAPSNVLLVDGIPKLCGFSSSAMVTQPTQVCTVRVGDYRAPELIPSILANDGSVFAEVTHPQSADIYSMGKTFHFAMSGGASFGQIPLDDDQAPGISTTDDLSYEARHLIG